MQPRAGSGPSPARLAAACAALLAAVALAHGGALDAGFVAFDDDQYVYENPHVQAGLSPESVAWAFRLDGRRTYFHPLTWLSLMADRTFLGPGPRGFHAVNVALHGVNALLLLALLVRTTGRLGASLAASLLFSVHPLTIEAVAWVTERKTVLSTALGLGALIAYAAHAARPSRWRLAASVALLAASLLAKPALVVLPALLLVLDLWPLRRLGPASADPGAPRGAVAARALLLEKLPFAAVSAAALALALASTRPISHADAEAAGAGLRVANALVSFPRYVAASVWPAGLSVFHLFPERVSALATLGGAAFLLAASAGAWRAAGRWPWVTAGWAWFVVALLPYLGLKQAGLWPAWAERFMYVPLMGLAIAAAFSAARAVEGRPRAGALAVGALGCAVLALGAGARAQGAHWKDSVALFERGAAIEPGSYVMNLGLGGALVRAGRVAEAEAAFRAAVAIHPTAVRARAALGAVLAATGREAEAEAQYQEALRLDPGDARALFSYAELLRRAGLEHRARPLYQAVVDLSPPGPPDLTARALRALGR